MTPASLLRDVTDRIRERSRATRESYLDRVRAAKSAGRQRLRLPCSNLAHDMAACSAAEKAELAGESRPVVAIVTAYNDMLSAHQPFESYPGAIKAAVWAAGGIAQVAGGVPAMCDGITQGRAGMELSLFSREVVAMATAVALSHDLFDGALLLGVCDKIVPGLVTGALTFGHLPTILVPAGPMPSGRANAEKSRIRQLYAEGKVGREALLDSEAASYHAPGTCTFYGTANSNQMLMEIMGLHLPGASFVPPGTPLRQAMTAAAARTIAGGSVKPIGELLDERALVNGIVGLLATGGSTNHTLHLPAMARAGGILLEWEDFDDLSRVVPLIARVYPNGPADINDFHRAGGMATTIADLLDAGLLHGDVSTVAGEGLAAYARVPVLAEDGSLDWPEPAGRSSDLAVLASVAQPFAPDGGLRVLSGNLGRAVIKVSAVKAQHRAVSAPCRVFHTQDAFEAAFKAGELNRDVVCVVRFQGPRANGMPELHKLIPALGVLQDLGYHVALVTDGRMSGASGKVPVALHVTPEAAAAGPIARLRDGDRVSLDCAAGTLSVALTEAELAARPPVSDPRAGQVGCGRELFEVFRQAVGTADHGASVFFRDAAR
jgi:phosphogluconate dehydratase